MEKETGKRHIKEHIAVFEILVNMQMQGLIPIDTTTIVIESLCAKGYQVE